MTARSEDVDALVRAIDRIVFSEIRAGHGSADASAETLGLVSYLSDSFPRVAPAAARRDRLQRRIARAMGLSLPAPSGLNRLEAEVNRRLTRLDPRWGPVVGGTALVLLGVLGIAVWRQRGSVKPAIAAIR